jgi:hypothetical protein
VDLRDVLEGDVAVDEIEGPAFQQAQIVAGVVQVPAAQAVAVVLLGQF